MAAQKPAKTDLENIDASGFVLFTADFRSDRMFSATHHNGIVRAPASVFRVPNHPSYTDERILKLARLFVHIRPPECKQFAAPEAAE